MEVGYLAVRQPRCSIAGMRRPQLLSPHQRLAAGQEGGEARMGAGGAGGQRWLHAGEARCSWLNPLQLHAEKNAGELPTHAWGEAQKLAAMPGSPQRHEESGGGERRRGDEGWWGSTAGC